MKFNITFKMPDAVDNVLNATCDMSDAQKAKAKEVASRFIEYDEYVDIEIDTEKGTATVLEV